MNIPHLWTPEEDALLGTDDDAVIARRIGVGKDAVFERRRKLEIQPHQPQRPWGPEEDALLGTDDDAVIARRLGRGIHAVRGRRKQLGIAAGTAHRRWTAEEDALLGKLPDRDVSNRLGRTVSSIQQRRHIRGIPACKTAAENHRRASGDVSSARPWSDAETALIGVLSHKQVAEKTGRALQEVVMLAKALGRHDVSDLIDLVERLRDDVPIALMLWYERTRTIPAAETLINACGITRPTAFRHIARARKMIQSVYSDERE